ncbi:hypothetical protein HYN48_02955 [Flavobacterium magnum]|uniref:Uncharacterized protein n=1 Tax=Flavobacterium magnum TaxID=2162713 RepID=A0A2S0RCZ4_9FLAO|nr:hypothetical protein HYN48_02955 [Flavobacterium magnum]
MSERWKFQIRTGVFWGVFMSFFQLLFEMKRTPVTTQLSDVGFYVATLAQILVGIFVVGYFSWTSRPKKS